jgi:hypothetical protein
MFQPTLASKSCNFHSLETTSFTGSLLRDQMSEPYEFTSGNAFKVHHILPGMINLTNMSSIDFVYYD